MRRFKLLPCFVAIFLFFTLDWTHAAIFTVINLNDSDIGSLRWAIDKANTNPGPDTINFKVSGIIVLLSGLQGIYDDGTVIDASSQWLGRYPGGKPGIVLNGSKTRGVHGLKISGASYCKVYGLFITGFYGDDVSGIRLCVGANNNYIGGAHAGARNIISGNNNGVDISNSHKNVIIGNYIGTDYTEALDMGNKNNGVLIHEGAQSNFVGGINPQERNIISGNGTDGVAFYDPGTDNNVVLGNYIGTNLDGKTALGNGCSGVRIDNGVKANIIGGRVPGARNIISGNYEDGVNILGSGTDNNLVSGNYIGTDAKGTTAIGNILDGVSIWNGAQWSVIGGINPGERNIISGNKGCGIAIGGSETIKTKVYANYIGTDASGTTALGNEGNGVTIVGGAQSNIIGGPDFSQRNIISGNVAQGINIDGSGTNGNTVSGNYIGTDVKGKAKLGNGWNGICIAGGARSNSISEDRIAFNGEIGIKVLDTYTDYNKISQNSIYDNTGLGIDLENGGNNEIPAPVIESNNLVDNALTVSGNGAGNNATVEFFKADSSTSGEGKTYLGSLTADESGNFSGLVDATGKSLSVGDSLVATTTHTDNNTSEFSQPCLVMGSATITVEIDIKPGSKPNIVNPDANGVIAVAILTTRTAKGESVDFNASTVDPLSVKFGSGEATKFHNKSHIEDVDKDGDKDLVLHFNMQETGIKAGDTEACLTGKTIDGKNIKGCDAIVTVPSKDKPALLAPASFTFKALEAYPQPCNPEVWIPYTLGQDVEVRITIHDTSGRLIRNLYLGNQNAGAYVTKDKAVYWDGKNETGEQSTSGIYFYTIKAGNFIATKKLVVLE